MAIRCLEVIFLPELTSVLEKCEQDFWVSSIAGIHSEQVKDRIATYRVEDRYAFELFTHCVFIVSDNIRLTADAVVMQVAPGCARH